MLKGLLKTMRPRQWVKNGFVFVVILFDGKIFDLPGLLRTIAAFILFCMAASTVYIMNDLADIESDRNHPRKKLRPLPSGQLSVSVARVAVLLFGGGALAGAFLISTGLGIVILTYLLVQIAYTFWLKNVVLLDVMLIATGFILRVAAGTTVIEVVRFSPWLYVCMGLLALFLGLGKRRHELSLLGEGASSHRPILKEYTLDLIDRLIGMVTTAVLVSYSLYTFMAEGLPENHSMMLTIPFALYFLFRYLYLIHVRGEGGVPEEILLRDRPLQIDLLLWVACVFVALYIV